MISAPDRREAVELINEARANGARLWSACAEFGITPRTLTDRCSRTRRRDDESGHEPSAPQAYDTVVMADAKRPARLAGLRF
jgi:hypothetical protein